MSEEVHWVPLEANPSVVEEYMRRAGVKGISASDVVALEPEALSWVPQPVLALVVLFPCTERYEEHKREEEGRLPDDPPADVFFLKQHAHNACGSIALVHCIANWAEGAGADRLLDGWLKEYLTEALAMNPEERGVLLEKGPAASAHSDLAAMGQSAAPDATRPSNHHFIALVGRGGTLYELDGRKKSPVAHGSTSPDSFLNDAARVCREFMARDPENVDFSVIALTEG